MVARLHGTHLRADLFHHARRLVPGNAGQRRGIGAVDEVEVRPADAACDGADQHLVRAGLVDAHILDAEGRLGLEEDGGFHRYSVTANLLVTPAQAGVSR